MPFHLRQAHTPKSGCGGHMGHGRFFPGVADPHVIDRWSQTQGWVAATSRVRLTADNDVFRRGSSVDWLTFSRCRVPRSWVFPRQKDFFPCNGLSTVWHVNDGIRRWDLPDPRMHTQLSKVWIFECGCRAGRSACPLREGRFRDCKGRIGK